MTTNGNGNNNITKKRQNTADRIIKALGEEQGLLTKAARRAGVSYTTINRYVHDFPSVKDAVQEAKESMLDFTEGKLYEKIKNGDTACIIFFLKTQGKGRGFIERQDIFQTARVEIEGGEQHDISDQTIKEALVIAYSTTGASLN